MSADVPAFVAPPDPFQPQRVPPYPQPQLVMLPPYAPVASSSIPPAWIPPLSHAMPPMPPTPPFFAVSSTPQMPPATQMPQMPPSANVPSVSAMHQIPPYRLISRPLFISGSALSNSPPQPSANMRSSTGLSPQDLDNLTLLQTLDAAAASVLGQCAICLDDYAAGDEIRRLPCVCAFHRACIDGHLANKRTCPLCRTEVSLPSKVQ
eukprot:m.184069 g.184069  ORF g.184069 m.184069 type:complete len:207 (-) comp53512_c1_seq5:108-728(-)